jgi:uncharacterized FlgJ-related protein
LAPTVSGDDSAFQENAPVDIGQYVESQRTPKYIRINTGHNVRSTPEFESARKDNIDFQTVPGSYFAVSRVVPVEDGVATGIYWNGEERWVFVPWKRKQDFQFCESEACFADLKQGLDAIASGAQLDPTDLLQCGITGVDAEGRPVMKPIPKSFKDVEIKPTPRQKEELKALDAKVNRAAKISSPTVGSCVADSRNRPKPNFRAYRSVAELKKAFIDYMTPYALEVQEATGLPASVVIGQAALESGWGRSSLFSSTKNIFGHSCWRQGSSSSLSVNIFGKEKSIVGSCDTPRPAGAGGYYLTFQSSQESVYAYASNLLSARHNFYPQVRSAVNGAKPKVANWRDVLAGLKNYDSPNPAYRDQVRTLILSNDLYKLEAKKLCR